MAVTFQHTDEFLDELKLEAADGRVDDGVVRITAVQEKPSQTQVVYRLTAGFLSLGELRQMKLACGTDCGQETAASDRCEAAIGAIETVCRELDLKVRGGAFEEE